jgi:hypothetical protein
MVGLCRFGAEYFFHFFGIHIFGSWDVYSGGVWLGLHFGFLFHQKRLSRRWFFPSLFFIGHISELSSFFTCLFHLGGLLPCVSFLFPFLFFTIYLSTLGSWSEFDTPPSLKLYSGCSILFPLFRPSSYFRFGLAVSWLCFYKLITWSCFNIVHLVHLKFIAFLSCTFHSCFFFFALACVGLRLVFVFTFQ